MENNASKSYRHTALAILAAALLGACSEESLPLAKEDTLDNQAPCASISVSPDLQSTAITTVTLITLDASASNDSDNDTLAYTWTQPSGQNIALSPTDSISTSFSGSAAGTYTFTLSVSDGIDSASATEPTAPSTILAWY